MFQGAAMLRTAFISEHLHAPLEHYLHTKGIHIGRDGSVIRVDEGVYDSTHRRFSRAIQFVDSDCDRGYWYVWVTFDRPPIIPLYGGVGYGFIRADTIISTLRGPVFRAVQRLQRAFREKRYKGNFIDCVVAWDLEVEEESEAEDNHGSDVDDSRPVPPWRPEVQRKLVVCRHWLNIRCTPGKLCRFLHATKKARCRFNPSTVRKAPQFIRPVPKTGINNRRVNRIKRELDSGLEEGDEGPSIPSYESYGLVGAGLDEDDGDGGAAVRGDSPSGDEVVAVKRARRSVGGV
jgi:hypothetical protein